jgi:hypothetical protein
MDSLIRLNQIYQPELSGYIASIVNSLLTFNTSGDIIPSGSGIKNLGSETNYYKNLYVNGISVPSGSGITIGNTFFTAYSSGGAGIVQVGDYKITSSGNFISIQGPQGIQGPTGATGEKGATGIGITGVNYNQLNYELTFNLSNNTNQIVNIPPLSGATGISITGFYKSGNFIYPQFDNFKGIGEAIELPSGAQGIQGAPGTVTLYFNSGTGLNSGSFSEVEFPKFVQIKEYYTEDPYPPISLMRGMSYTFNSSGLYTHQITELDYILITGILNNPNVPIDIIGSLVNYYSDPLNGTGYWRVSFFDSGAATGIYSGLYDSETGFFNAISGKNNEIYGSDFYTDIYRTSLTFNTKFTAKDQYKYGFVVYSLGELGDEALNNGSIEGSKSIAIIVGDTYVSSGVGPRGPIGPQGTEGPPGTGVGPKGDPGAGIIAINQGDFQIQFVFADDTVSDWINLPQGGPSGAQGPPGSLINYFSGEYSSNIIYKLNDTVSRLGSTYIYTGSSPQSGYIPENGINWQLLAKSGEKGQTGATGERGIADKYSSSFNVVSGFPTGIESYQFNITGITVDGVSLSGTGAIFKVGQKISFKNSGINGYSYTPYQNIVVSSNSINNSYFYGSINNYNSNSGIISFTVLSGGTGIINSTISGDYYLWYNYQHSTINLGANLMSGAVGPQGPIGPQGPAGNPSLLRNSGILYLDRNVGGNFILNPSGFDVFNITITGDDTAGNTPIGIDFDWDYFQTGKCVLVRIRNSGISNGNIDPPLFYFTGVNGASIKWPGEIYTRPNSGEFYIYSILRFMDEDDQSLCFGTYSNPYK